MGSWEWGRVGDGERWGRKQVGVGERQKVTREGIKRISEKLSVGWT